MERVYDNSTCWLLLEKIILLFGLEKGDGLTKTPAGRVVLVKSGPFLNY
jgi:hypothetical protein